MSTPPITTPQAARDADIAERIVQQAYARERERRRRPLPAWVPPAMRVLPRVLAITTILNGIIGLVSVVYPFLRMAFGPEATGWIFSAYSYICPQRPDHTWFINGVPMAMEQRMVSMYLAFGLAGLMYIGWERMRRPLPTWIAAVLIAPVVIDVAISTVGILPSTGVSRLWTGALSAWAIVWWAYPRYTAQLAVVRAHIRAREQQSGPR